MKLHQSLEYGEKSRNCKVQNAAYENHPFQGYLRPSFLNVLSTPSNGDNLSGVNIIIFLSQSLDGKIFDEPSQVTLGVGKSNQFMESDARLVVNKTDLT